MTKKSKNYTPSILFDALPDAAEVTKAETAIVYCEAKFGTIDGKTANGLIRHSEKYKILSVIDSERPGEDSGKVLNNEANGIPIFRDLGTALAQAGKPDYLIYGIAPVGGMLSLAERRLLLRAIGYGINIVIGLHEYLNEDEEFIAACAKTNVVIRDVRKPRKTQDLQVFSGKISEVTCPRIAVLGTDTAVGKRTTATVLAKALNDRGIKTIVIGTGQTSLIQGAKYALAMDAIPAQFAAGELEDKIVEAFQAEDPDVILIEGQSSLSHPAFTTTSSILRGSCPQGVILQHAPARKHRCDFPEMPMPEPSSEIAMIEAFSDTKVIGLTLYQEEMTASKFSAATKSYQRELAIPVTGILVNSPKSPQVLIEMVRSVFPQIGDRIS